MLVVRGKWVQVVRGLAYFNRQMLACSPNDAAYLLLRPFPKILAASID